MPPELSYVMSDPPPLHTKKLAFQAQFLDTQWIVMFFRHFSTYGLPNLWLARKQRDQRLSRETTWQLSCSTSASPRLRDRLGCTPKLSAFLPPTAPGVQNTGSPSNKFTPQPDMIANLIPKTFCVTDMRF